MCLGIKLTMVRNVKMNVPCQFDVFPANEPTLYGAGVRFLDYLRWLGARGKREEGISSSAGPCYLIADGWQCYLFLIVSSQMAHSFFLTMASTTLLLRQAVGLAFPSKAESAHPL